MTHKLPYMAMDGVLCDRPQDGCFIGGGKRNYARDNINKKETRMAHVMTKQEIESHTKKLVARILGQDSAVDDETAARIKEFLSDKLSDKDHTALCAMLNGENNVEAAEDTEPAPDDVELPKNAIERKRSAAADAQADFLRRFPDASRTRIDNSGIQPPPRVASYSADGAASFAAMFPDSARIKVL